MIKLTYRIVCDLCKKECNAQEFECTNYPQYEFPRPTRVFTYDLQGMLEMCNECAAPLIQAKRDRIEEVLLQQNPLFAAQGKLL
jgi:hypothetical protein